MTTKRTDRRADEFERALAAEPGARLDPTMATLVAVAGALVAVPQRSAPAFRDALRTRLMAEAATVLPAGGTPAAPPAAASGAGGAARTLNHVLGKPAVQVATGGLAAVVAATGLAVNTSRSLPGDPLYDVKRTVERWQVGLAGGRTSEATALLEHVDTRLDEVRDLLRRGALSEVAGVLDTLNAELRSATDRLLSAAGSGSRPAYDELRATIADLQRQLRRMYDGLPSAARDEADAVFATLNAAAARLAAVPPPPVVKHPPKPSKSPSPSDVAPTETPSSVVPSETPSGAVPSETPSDVVPTLILPTPPPLSFPPLDGLVP